MKLRDYFSYTASEKKGFLFLLVLLIVTLSSYWIIPFFISDSATDFSEIKKEIEAFRNQKEDFKIKEIKEESKDSDKKPVVELKEFDPNQVDADFWMSMGFSEKQAASIIKFRNKYGFKSKEDVKKLYVMSDDKYRELSPYIVFGEVKQEEKKEKEEEQEFKVNEFSNSASLKENYHQSIIHLNTADTIALKSLKGIGSSFSKRIIKYRDLLGGFYSVNQLKEVYGLSEEVIEENRARIMVNPDLIKKINVNTCEAADLKVHPYINWNLANSIVQLRKTHGNYETLAEIKKSDLVNDEIYRTIAPYLKID